MYLSYLYYIIYILKIYKNRIYIIYNNSIYILVYLLYLYYINNMGEKMKTIAIKIPEILHSKFKVLAAQQKKTMKEKIIKMIEKEVMPNGNGEEKIDEVDEQ